MHQISRARSAARQHHSLLPLRAAECLRGSRRPLVDIGRRHHTAAPASRRRTVYCSSAAISHAAFAASRDSRPHRAASPPSQGRCDEHLRPPCAIWNRRPLHLEAMDQRRRVWRRPDICASSRIPEQPWVMRPCTVHRALLDEHEPGTTGGQLRRWRAAALTGQRAPSRAE